MDTMYKILAAVGGSGVIIIGFSKLIGNILRDRLKEQERKRSEFALETMRQHYSLRRIQADKFASSQFDIYLELWETLQALRLAVDVLWNKVTKQNISNLLRQLRTTEQKVNDWSIFFEEEHLQELRRLLGIIESFHTGKLLLSEIRTEKDLDYLKFDEIKNQIEQNRKYKEQLEQLLDKLRCYFHKQLSSIDSTDLS
jgi:hypothetical protein